MLLTLERCQVVDGLSRLVNNQHVKFEAWTTFKDHRDVEWAYTLRSVIVYEEYKNNPGRWHYYCYVRSFNDWHYLNDCEIKLVQVDEVLKAKAYILTYDQEDALSETYRKMDNLIMSLSSDYTLTKARPSYSLMGSPTPRTTPSEEEIVEETETMSFPAEMTLEQRSAALSAALSVESSTARNRRALVSTEVLFAFPLPPVMVDVIKLNAQDLDRLRPF